MALSWRIASRWCWSQPERLGLIDRENRGKLLCQSMVVDAYENDFERKGPTGALSAYVERLSVDDAVRQTRSLLIDAK